MSTIGADRGAQVALATLARNDTALQRAQRQAATGLAIGSARDDAGIFSVAVGVRADLDTASPIMTGLSRAHGAVSVALAASGDMRATLDLVRLDAVRLSDHSLAAWQRAIFVAEINQQLATLDDQAHQSGFGVHLLDTDPTVTTTSSAPTSPPPPPPPPPPPAAPQLRVTTSSIAIDAPSPANGRVRGNDVVGATLSLAGTDPATIAVEERIYVGSTLVGTTSLGTFTQAAGTSFTIQSTPFDDVAGRVHELHVEAQYLDTGGNLVASVATLRFQRNDQTSDFTSSFSDGPAPYVAPTSPPPPPPPPASSSFTEPAYRVLADADGRTIDLPSADLTRTTLVGSLDGSAVDADPTGALTTIDRALADVTALQAKLGATDRRIEAQLGFLRDRYDAAQGGLGALVDADLGRVSASLLRLQQDRLLALDGLAGSNGSAQALLALFASRADTASASSSKLVDLRS